MTFIGTVSKGAILLPPDVKLPDGLQLEVTIPELRTVQGSTGERLLKFAGLLHELPTDLARNHDHYIHGAPKR